MMESKLDIFFIILFIIVVSVIIGLNIVTVIDKKISNVSVNIPPIYPQITIPPPNIVLNIDKKITDLINISVENDNTEVLNSTSKRSDTSNNNENIENFIVADANDFKRYDELKKNTLKKDNSFDTEDLDNPINERVVDYDKDKKKDDDFTIQLNYPDHTIEAKPKEYKPVRDNKAYITAADFGFDPPRQVVGCANSSISQKWKGGEHSLVANRISCNKPNKLTAENYYKTQYKPIVIPMEDVRVRGYNYAEYSNAVMPERSDIRILSQSTKGLNPKETKIQHLPDGFNYGFHNSPAMAMP
jgi:hypothetical protein